jgi:hypothetical protein
VEIKKDVNSVDEAVEKFRISFKKVKVDETQFPFDKLRVDITHVSSQPIKIVKKLWTLCRIMLLITMFYEAGSNGIRYGSRARIAAEDQIIDM